MRDPRADLFYAEDEEEIRRNTPLLKDIKDEIKSSHKEYHEYVEALYKQYDVNKVRDLLKVCTKEEAENITRMQLAL